MRDICRLRLDKQRACRQCVRGTFPTGHNIHQLRYSFAALLSIVITSAGPVVRAQVLGLKGSEDIERQMESDVRSGLGSFAAKRGCPGWWVCSLRLGGGGGVASRGLVGGRPSGSSQGLGKLYGVAERSPVAKWNRATNDFQGRGKQDVFPAASRDGSTAALKVVSRREPFLASHVGAASFTRRHSGCDATLT